MLSQHSKKHHHTDAANVVPDPLVDPGNPSHRHQARSTAHLDRPCSRLVALAVGSPGRCSSRPSQKENATVMLVIRDNIIQTVLRAKSATLAGSDSGFSFGSASAG